MPWVWSVRHAQSRTHEGMLFAPGAAAVTPVSHHPAWDGRWPTRADVLSLACRQSHRGLFSCGPGVRHSNQSPSRSVEGRVSPTGAVKLAGNPGGEEEKASLLAGLFLCGLCHDAAGLPAAFAEWSQPLRGPSAGEPTLLNEPPSRRLMQRACRLPSSERCNSRLGEDPRPVSPPSPLRRRPVLTQP